MALGGYFLMTMEKMQVHYLIRMTSPELLSTLEARICLDME
jgi:hypothetical protein